MQKKTKTILIVLTSLVAACCVMVGIGSVTSGGGDTTTSSVSTSAPTTTNPPVTTTAAPTAEELLIGKWRDSADMSGYEFFEDGTVEVTYVNLTVPFINIPVNGTTKGTYTVKDDTIITKFSIYSATIDTIFKFKVTEKELSMTNLEEFETATYMRVEKGSEPDTSAPATNTTSEPATKNDDVVLYDDELVGSWLSSDSKIRYNFTYDGTVDVKPAGSADTYSGIYLTDGTKLTVQYVKNGKKITEKFSYKVSKNSMSLTDSSKNQVLFVREGTGSVSVSEDELYGKWMDGANVSGYEFKPDGLVEVTYANFTIPVVNIPINGTFTGAYSVEDGLLTVSLSLRGVPMNNTYSFEIKGNTLSLQNVETGDRTTYIKQ